MMEHVRAAQYTVTGELLLPTITKSPNLKESSKGSAVNVMTEQSEQLTLLGLVRALTNYKVIVDSVCKQPFSIRAKRLHEGACLGTVQIV